MNLTGVFAPIPTPFDSDHRVDTARLRAALARWVTTPLTGFVVLGLNLVMQHSGIAPVYNDSDESARRLRANSHSVRS